MPTESLEGKVAAITGASSGIGEATAVALAQAGAAVAVGARREDRLEGWPSASRTRAAARSRSRPTSPTRGRRERSSRPQRELGGLDILVNNAGVMLSARSRAPTSSNWRRMVEVNVLGLLYCTHAALPIMGERAAGTS